MPAGKLKAICISERKGERKRPLAQVELVEAHGLAGDAHAGPWHRQVSLLADEDISRMREKGLPDLKAGDFAENLVTSGMDLAGLGLGSRLRIGAKAEVIITQIGKVCHDRCAIYHQTGDCIMPRQGLFARVTASGPIRTGDTITLEEQVPRECFQAVVLTISDRCARGEALDTAGPAVVARLQSEGMHIYRHKILPDEQAQIAETLRHYADGHSIDLVVATGGTGFAPRDVTPEAVRSVAERLTPGLDETMRSASAAFTPHALLSRATSGIRKNTLLISLPGSERAATENLEALFPALAHGLAKLRGDLSDCAPNREQGYDL